MCILVHFRVSLTMEIMDVFKELLLRLAIRLMDLLADLLRLDVVDSLISSRFGEKKRVPSVATSTGAPLL